MKFFNSVALAAAILAKMGSAVPVESEDGSQGSTSSGSPIKVELSKADGNAMVFARLTNTGNEPINVFKHSQLIDSHRVQKLDVTKDGKEVEFHGFKIRRHLGNLAEKDFELLAPGQSINTTVNVAELYDLNSTGEYSIVARGYVQTADSLDARNEQGGIPLSKVYDYTSNALDLTVDGKSARRVKRHLDRLYTRSKMASNCNGQEGQALRAALANCAKIANEASRAALNGNDEVFKAFFTNTDSRTRQQVSDRLAAIGKECAAGQNGKTNYHCTPSDVRGLTRNPCNDGSVLAFTIGRGGPPDIWNCPLYYRLPAVPQSCGNNDQASTSLHEMAHVDKVFSPGTTDVGSYGARACMRLPANLALKNADTFAFYSSFTALGCRPDDLGRRGNKEYTPATGNGGGSQGGDDTGSRSPGNGGSGGRGDSEDDNDNTGGNGGSRRPGSGNTGNDDGNRGPRGPSRPVNPPSRPVNPPSRPVNPPTGGGNRYPGGSTGGSTRTICRNGRCTTYIDGKPVNVGGSRGGNGGSNVRTVCRNGKCTYYVDGRPVNAPTGGNRTGNQPEGGVVRTPAPPASGGNRGGNQGGNRTGGNQGGNRTGGNQGGNQGGNRTGGNRTGGNTGPSGPSEGPKKPCDKNKNRSSKRWEVEVNRMVPEDEVTKRWEAEVHTLGPDDVLNKRWEAEVHTMAPEDELTKRWEVEVNKMVTEN